MEWIIKIDNKKDRRIMVYFEPLQESIRFVGQFKPRASDMVNSDIKNGFIWVDISEDKHSMNIDFKTLNEYIERVYDKMEERLKVQEDLSKTFTVFKAIKIKEVKEVED